MSAIFNKALFSPENLLSSMPFPPQGSTKFLDRGGSLRIPDGHYHVFGQKYCSGELVITTPESNKNAADEPDESVEKLLKRISRCTITLELYDKDEFVFRRHPVPFIRGVDPEHARLHSLYANDTFQMDAQEYRQFIDSGSWTVLWDCGFTP
jgi:hypothetical protein